MLEEPRIPPVTHRPKVGEKWKLDGWEHWHKVIETNGTSFRLQSPMSGATSWYELEQGQPFNPKEKNRIWYVHPDFIELSRCAVCDLTFDGLDYLCSVCRG